MILQEILDLEIPEGYELGLIVTPSLIKGKKVIRISLTRHEDGHYTMRVGQIITEEFCRYVIESVTLQKIVDDLIKRMES